MLNQIIISNLRNMFHKLNIQDCVIDTHIQAHMSYIEQLSRGLVANQSNADYVVRSLLNKITNR